MNKIYENFKITYIQSKNLKKAPYVISKGESSFFNFR